MPVTYQHSILAAPPKNGRSLAFRLALEADPRPALARLRGTFVPDMGVVGLGDPLVRTLGHKISGLRSFPALSGAAYAIPSTQQALWVFLRGADRGATFDLSEQVVAALASGFLLDDAMDTFAYAGGRDLTGYQDGTANPGPVESIEVAIESQMDAPTGSSFVAVQRWAHDLARFRSHSQAECDAMIGRRRNGNEEMADAPESAHVKRSAQELFDPPAFMVRRSQPWATAHEQGLEFIAYGRTLDAFERVLRRMAGIEDNIGDALFAFSRPLTGGYYWCPPLRDGKLDLSAVGL